MNIRILLNGKKAGLESVRSAIFKSRESGVTEVRSTWEGGDIKRLVREAINEDCQRLVAGGGDGTVNEVIDALLSYPENERPELAILPLGTANDFAMACMIPTEPYAALSLARSGHVYAVDAVKANEHHFINVASGGFGAQVTANTPVALKNFLGGGAYTLTGLIQALNFTPYYGKINLPHETVKRNIIASAVCNSKQAGGGQQLAPDAKIDDGLLDLVSLAEFPAENVSQVIRELMDTQASSHYVQRYRVPWVEWESEVEVPINLDGEPISTRKIRFEVLPAAIKLVLPEGCPMITGNS